MEKITSRSNRWIKLAGQLKYRKYRNKLHLFIMEGLRCVKDALIQQQKDVVCLFTPQWTGADEWFRIVENGRKLDWLFLEIASPLADQISDTVHGQGIFLILKIPQYASLQDIGRLKGLYVLLDHVQDPGNVGTILRTAAAAGCRGVFLTEGTADPYSEKAVRSSMGSILRVPVYTELGVEDVKNLRKKSGIPLIGTSLNHALPYKKAPFVSDAILAFGNEGNGMSQELLDAADWNLFIPLAGTVESLNITAAVAIILFYYKKDPPEPNGE